jgi:hypothetical protein
LSQPISRSFMVSSSTATKYYCTTTDT